MSWNTAVRPQGPLKPYIFWKPMMSTIQNRTKIQLQRQIQRQIQQQIQKKRQLKGEPERSADLLSGWTFCQEDPWAFVRTAIDVLSVPPQTFCQDWPALDVLSRRRFVRIGHYLRFSAAFAIFGHNFGPPTLQIIFCKKKMLRQNRPLQLGSFLAAYSTQNYFLIPRMISFLWHSQQKCGI